MPDIDNGKRIIDQTTGTVAPDDSFIVDSLTNGTRKASYTSVAEQIGNTLNISSISALASGAMQKTVYDADGDGVVDNAEKLGNQAPAYYATKQSVDDLDSAVMKKSVYDTNNNGAADRADAVAWSGVENTPETLAGYGISSVPVTALDGVIDSENLPDTDWGRIQNTPTTLSGYGITDAYTKIQTDDAIEEGMATTKEEVGLSVVGGKLCMTYKS